MLYLVKLTTKKIIFIVNMTVPTMETQKTWNEMIYLSTFTFLRYMAWNVEALSIHFTRNWSDHTAIEIVSCGTSRNFCCFRTARLFHSRWLHVHWLILSRGVVFFHRALRRLAPSHTHTVEGNASFDFFFFADRWISR